MRKKSIIVIPLALLFSINAQSYLYFDKSYWQDNIGHLQHIQNDIDFGLKLKEARDPYSRTILHYAATGATNHEVIKLLVKIGIDVNARDFANDTPLHEAAHKNRQSQIVSTLIASGALVNASNNYGNIPLHNASSSNNLADVKVLIKAGSKVNFKDRDGRTPLYLAVIDTENLGIVKQLVEAGARVNFKDNKDVSLLEAAKQNKNPKIYEYLQNNSKN